MQKTLRIKLLYFVCTLVVLTALFGTAIAADIDRDARIVHVQLDPVPSLDPANPGGSMTAQEVFRHIYDNLVSFDENLTPQPNLAESWTTSADGKTWVFNLRHGVKFHDGTPFTAEAVKFTFDRIADPAQASAIQSLFVQIDRVEVIDDYTVRFVTKDPFGPMLNYLAHGGAGIVCPAAVEKWGEEFRLHPVGTGPYYLKEFLPGEKVVIVRNADHWQEPAIAEITFIPVAEDGTRAFMLQTGEADSIVPVPVNMVENLNASPGMEVLNKPIISMVYVGFNLSKEFLQDIRVRQALTYAIDKEALVSKLMLGAATVADSPMAVGTFGYKGTTLYQYDPQKAKELLDEAGWKANSEGIREKDGQLLKFTLWTPQGLYVKDTLLAQTIQSWWQAVGADVTLRTIESAAWYDTLKVPVSEAVYDTFLWSLTPSTGDGNQQLVELVQSDPDPTLPPMAWNLTRYNNPEVDALIQRGLTSVDPEVRMEVLGAAQEIVVEEAPLVFLYSLNQLVGVRDYLKGVRMLPNRFVDFREAYVVRH